MKREEFSLALNALLPGCDPRAADKWAEFADECVAHEQYVYFIPVERDAAVEKWLDATLAGLYATRQEYGLEITVEVAGLVCHQCALYPGEMPAAAVALKNGNDAKQVKAMMLSGKLMMDQRFFFDLPDGAALTLQGAEISIAQSGVPCGVVQKRVEPGFLLADGTALLESERDTFGRYRGGAGMDGMYLQTGRLYAPVRGLDGMVRAFQEVKPVTAQEREMAFLSSAEDGFAIYHLNHTKQKECASLARLQKEGKSPLDGGYNLVHIVYTEPWSSDDGHKTLEACRVTGVLKPGDIMALKQGSAVMCWYTDQIASSKLPGLLENYMKSAELGAEQNYNQIDGIINNEASKPSLLDTLRQCREDTGKSQGGTAPPCPSHDPER